MVNSMVCMYMTESD